MTVSGRPRRTDRPGWSDRVRGWFAPEGGADRAPARQEGAPEGVVPIAKATFKEFGADHGTLMAAAVAFYFVLSLIPLVLVGVWILGLVLGNDASARQQAIAFLAQFLPTQGDTQLVQGAVQAVIEERGTIGLIGIAGLLFTALGGFSTLETSINAIWKVPNRSFLWNKLFALGMMLVIGLLFALSLVVTTAAQWAGELPVLSWLAENGGLRALGYLLPILISGLMFSVIYRYFPNTETEWRPALIAGFITAVLWEVFKIGYTYYSTHWADQAATYGTLGGFVGLILWIYYSSALVLLGSELTWVLNGCPRREQSERPA